MGEGSLHPRPEGRGIRDPPRSRCNKTIENIGYPEWWLEYSGYQYGPRVYDLESLHRIPDVKYAGKTVNVTSGDMIGYIREHQTGNSYPALP